MSALREARIRHAGEAALSIELGDKIDPAVHERVLALDEAVARAQIDGVRETVPSYRALLVTFEPERIGHVELISRLDALEPEAITLTSQSWSVPACFENDFADDMEAVCEAVGLDRQAIVAALTSSKLRLFMYGFAPGFAYLGGLDPRLAIPRRATPRNSMPPGSVMIAGGQASIASVSMPTGWYVVGRTPLNMFQPEREPMVPFQPGDEIALRAVSPEDFRDLRKRAEAGQEILRALRGDDP